MEAMDGVVGEPRRRRVHRGEFKAQVVQACRQPGASIAAVALSHGLNANLVRRWINAADTAGSGGLALEPSQGVRPQNADASRAFLPVQMEIARPGVTQIRLELRRGASSVIVDWPATEAACCGSWLREWLR